MNGPDPALLNIFAAEQAEHVEHIRALLDRLAGAAAEERPSVLERLMRRAHTLKGAARAVGLDATEQIVHRLESVFADSRDTSSTVDRTLVGRALDIIEDVLAAAQGVRVEPDTAALLRELGGGQGISSEPAERPPADSVQTAGDDLVRVPAATLDAVIRFSSELLTTTAGDTRTTAELSEHARELDEAHREYQRLRRACSAYLQLHADAAESAPLAECLSFVDDRWAALRRRAARAAATQQQRSWKLRREVAQLHEHASRARMVPADSAFGAFGPMVRALADAQGKQIVFRAEGADVQADRLVLQGLKDAVMHLLRNAVSHGIEPPDARRQAGKPEAGAILLAVRARGDRLELRIEDDGAGVDTAAVAAEAARKGLVDDASAVPPARAFRLLFEPGFTTLRTLSEVSGRGMGLSAVREAVSRLQGEISITPARPGTRVRISVPLSIATQQVLLVDVEGHTYGLPGVFIAAVQRRKHSEVIQLDGRSSVVFESEPVPLVRLANLVGLEATQRDPSTGFHVVITSAGGGKAGLVVDQILEDREAIVRDTGLSAAQRGFSAGAVPLEDGSTAVLLDVAELMQQLLRTPGRAAFTAPEPPPRKARVLVVDDSITTRSVERSILEAHGYEVEVAVDGVEALDKVRGQRPDLIISDVAMPRMDGFELLERLKSGRDTSGIPVILVTSLDKREEQERGLSLGADAYIVKRKFDQRDLIATVRQIL